MFIKKIINRRYMLALMGILGSYVISSQIIVARERMILVAGNSIGDKSATGMARIITKPDQWVKVSKGEIIVTHTTDFSCEPMMSRAVGIITDQGDSNSHAALFGKRAGIPVIVGAGNATKKIIDGQSIMIDCAKCTVLEILNTTDQELVTHHAGMGGRSSVASSTDTSSVASSYSAVSISRSVIPEGHNQLNKKPAQDAKYLYSKHYFDFERYVLGLKSQ